MLERLLRKPSPENPNKTLRQLKSTIIALIISTGLVTACDSEPTYSWPEELETVCGGVYVTEFFELKEGYNYLEGSVARAGTELGLNAIKVPLPADAPQDIQLFLVTHDEQENVTGWLSGWNCINGQWTETWNNEQLTP